MRFFQAFVSAALLIFILSPLYSQENLVERTICVLDPVDRSEEVQQMESISLLVADTIGVRLAEKGYTVIDNSHIRDKAEEEGLSGEELFDKRRILDFAADLGADVVVNGMYRIEGREVLVGIKAYDMFTRRIAAGVIEIGAAGFDIYDTVDAVSERVAGRIRENLKPLPASVITVEREKIRVEKKVVEEVVSIGKDVAITFYSKDEGAELLLGGEKQFAVIRDGTASFTAKADTNLEIVIHKENYHDRVLNIEVGEEEQEIILPKLYRRTRWDLGGMVRPQLPFGLTGQFRYHFIPDYLLVQSTAGFFYMPSTYKFWEEVEYNPYMLHGRIDVALGWYPFVRPWVPVRPLVGFGLSGTGYIIEESEDALYPFLGITGFAQVDVNFPEFTIFARLGFDAAVIYQAFGSFPAIGYFGIGATWKR